MINKKYKKIISMLLMILFIQMNLLTNDVKADEYSDFINVIVVDGYLTHDLKYGLPANLSTYKKYGRVVYGDSKDVPNNEKDELTGEYRYLGFNQKGIKVTNLKFPNEVPISGNPKYWHYIDIQGAENTWNLDDKRLSDYNWNAKIYGHGVENMYVKDIGSKSKVKLQVPATLLTGGSIKVEHIENGKWRYATFEIMPWGSNHNIKGEIVTNKTAYTIEENENEVDVDVNLHAWIDGWNKIFTKDYIKQLGISLSEVYIDKNLVSKNIPAISGTAKLDIKQSSNIKFDRSDFRLDKEIHEVKFVGRCNFQTIFSDTIVQKPLEKTIQIIVKNGHFPEAKIIADKTAFTGDKIQIVGIGNDRGQYKVDPPDKLTFNWTTPKGINLDNHYPNIGGEVVFNKEGTYDFELEVSNTAGNKATARHTINVLQKGDIALNLNATNKPTQVKATVKEDNSYTDEEKIKTVSINATGEITGLKESGKEVKKLQLVCIQAPADYVGDGIINPSGNIVQEYSLDINDNSISYDKFKFDIDITNFLSDKSKNDFKQYFQVWFFAQFTDGTTKNTYMNLETTFFKFMQPQEEPKNHKPCAIITRCPKKVIMGNDFTVRSTATDKDGDELRTSWGYDSFVIMGDLHETDFGGKAWANSEGEFDIVFHAKEKDTKEKLQDEDRATVIVLPPIPKPDMTIAGKRKINRKLSLDVKDLGGCSKRYPVNWDKVKWSIQPLQHQDINNIKTLSEYKIIGTGSNKYMYLEGHYPSFDMLFKQTGQYYIKVSLQSTAGEKYSAYTERIITIEGDQPPIARCEAPTQCIRNPLEDNYATANILDDSISLDDDVIGKRIWLYAWDSDNDGNLEEEVWYVFDNDKWQPISNYGISSFENLKDLNIDLINDGNKKRIQVKNNIIGDYRVHLIVREKLTNDNTIFEFITNEDLLTDSTFEN